MNIKPVEVIGTMGRYVVDNPDAIKAGVCVLVAASAGVLVGGAVFLYLQGNI